MGRQREKERERKKIKKEKEKESDVNIKGDLEEKGMKENVREEKGKGMIKVC